MDSMFEAAGRRPRRSSRRVCEPLERQAGALFAINGVIVGLDLFDSPATWRKLMPKLVHCYGLDALDRQPRRRREAKPDPALFVHTLAKATVTEFPAIGLGKDLRLEGKGLVGGALASDDSLVHLVAFAM